MDLDPECQLLVEKKYLSEEGKKGEKHSPPKRFRSLKKRSDFLFLKKNGFSSHGDCFIINFLERKNKSTRIGITVTKKLGNAVKRNYIKRVLRAILIENYKKLPECVDLEIIPKKNFLDNRFVKIKQDILDLISKINFKIIEKN